MRVLTTGLDSMAEFEAECLQGVQFGMDGKTLIHPKQIAGANRAFAPSDSEVLDCRQMIEAHARKDCVAQVQGALSSFSRDPFYSTALLDSLNVAMEQRR